MHHSEIGPSGKHCCQLHKHTLPGHLSPPSGRQEVSQVSPPGLAWAGETDEWRESQGNWPETQVWEEEDKSSSRIISPILGFILPSPAVPAPHCAQDPILSTVRQACSTRHWTACSLLQGKILAVTFKSTIFYRHDYHSPFAGRWLVAVMTPRYVLWAIKKMAKDRLIGSEKTEIATWDTTSVSPLF